MVPKVSKDLTKRISSALIDPLALQRKQIEARFSNAGLNMASKIA